MAEYYHLNQNKRDLLSSIFVPENVPMSYLDNLSTLFDTTLFYVSDPDERTETQFMSKYLTYKYLYTNLCNLYEIGKFKEDLCSLYKNAISLSDFISDWISCNVPCNPYIISAYHQGISTDSITDKLSIGLLEVKGYRLSTAIQTVFTNLGTNPYTTELSFLIPQLNYKKTSVNRPLEHYISSIYDEYGHVKSYEYGNFSDILNTNIGLVKKTVSRSGNYISCVSMKSGSLCDPFGDNSITSQTGSIEYCDISDNDNDNANLTFHKHKLQIIKLRNAQYKSLETNHKILKDCLYMTIDDLIDNIKKGI